jgi:hypothetical protein
MAQADPMGRSGDELEGRMKERGIPMGTAEHVREVIAEYEAAGVDRIHVQHLGPFDRDLLEELFAAIRG